jgi:hypothetical protein
LFHKDKQDVEDQDKNEGFRHLYQKDVLPEEDLPKAQGQLGEKFYQWQP